MTDREWLDGLKAGDEVIVDRGSGPAFADVFRVTHATKTQIVVSGWRFRRKDGRWVGAGSSSGIRQPTPEAQAEITEARSRAQAYRRLRNESWKALTTDQLTRIVAILDESEASATP